jgi:hypothetical protein
METLKILTHVAADGMVHLSVPQHFANQPVEVVLVLHSVDEIDAFRVGFPMDYFSRMDAITSDDIIERGDQGQLEMREPIE